MAIGNLQAATMLELSERAFSVSSNRLQNVRQFSSTQFGKALDQIGDRKLEALFATNPQGLSTLRAIRGAAEDATPSGREMVKGSGAPNLDIVARLLNNPIVRVTPGLRLVGEFVQGTAEGAGERAVAARATRGDLESLQQIRTQFPAFWGVVSAAGGLQGIDTLLDDQQQD